MAFVWIAVLIVALAVLVKSSDIFIDKSEKIGLKLGISSFILGITIVSIGTSLPELVTAILAVFQGLPNLPIENIVGSNIANTLIVVGVSAVLVRSLIVKNQLIDVDLPLLFISASLFMLFIWDGVFNWKEGVVSLLMFTVFMWYTTWAKKEKPENQLKTVILTHWDIILFVGALIGIFFGGKYTIDSVVKIVEIFDLKGTAIITMLVIAIGTSLPEMLVSVKAALKGKHAIALGNVFGSNTFNVLIVSSIPSFFGDLTVSPVTMTVGIPFFIVGTLAFMFTTTDDVIRFWEGLALLVVYVAFIGKLTGII